MLAASVARFSPENQEAAHPLQNPKPGEGFCQAAQRFRELASFFVS